MSSMNVDEFLRAETPETWLKSVPEHLPALLVDHANCEKKAASTAMNLMYRYDSETELAMRLSKLAREELRHFEQVLAILKKRGLPFEHVSPSRYAGELRKPVRTYEPARLVDTLIVCAIVEARSCERFEKLIPVLQDMGEGELAEFYESLLKSEARHFNLYLDFARQFADSDIQDRIDVFLAEDSRLVEAGDTDFRFHSGPVLESAGA